MLKLKLSKFKHICASVILPRILLKNLKYPNELSYSRTLDQLSKARKSTNSNERNTDNEKHVIDQHFSENISDTEAKDTKKFEVYYKDVITPEYYKLTQCEKCNFIISKVFDENAPKNDPSVAQTKLQATTSRIEEEKLAQKVEIIEETPHVEAHPPKIDGFNVTPKVLGQESWTLEISKKSYQGGDGEQQTTFDELAKRCMGAPVGEMDKVIAQELKNISQRKPHPTDLDFVRNQCLENDNQNADIQLGLLYDITPTRFEKILPFHLDSTPLLALDSSSIVTNDYKDSSPIRYYPTILLTVDVDEPSGTPAQLSPYEKPAIPFYEYINKENIQPDDSSKMESAVASETVDETEIVIDEDTLQKDVIPPQPSIEGEALHPKPNINQCTETKQSGNLIKNSILSIFNTQRVFSSNSDQPNDWQMTGQQYQTPPQQNEVPSSSISSAYLPGGNRRTIDLPANTAISANQLPDEYYSVSLPEEYLPENETTPVQRLCAECPVTQNMLYAALPKVEFEDIPKRTETNSDNTLSENEPLSHMIQETEIRQEEANEANLTEAAEKKDSISCSESIPLSMLLKKIREQNRLEHCRNLIAKAQIDIEGTKKFSCPPPLDKNKPKTSVKPCQPEPKPACKPCPAPCPPECPTKKDPCAKFVPIFSGSIYRYGTYHEDIIPRELLEYDEVTLSPVNIITRVVVKSFKGMGEKLKLIDDNNGTFLANVEMYARDFEPWVPIPSWPIPKKEEPKPFVCPKEGCKLPAAQTNKPFKGKQCDGTAKRPFASELFYHRLPICVTN